MASGQEIVPAGENTEGQFFDYHENLRADIITHVGEDPKAFVHSREWKKILNGDPVEINPSEGHGFKIMTVEEWSKRWKRNEDFPDCLACGSKSTKEHHFVQSWCRGKKKWESEVICMDCHMWSHRTYSDPDFMTPEDYEKVKWESMVKGVADDQGVQPAEIQVV